MVRPLRVDLVGQWYHVISRGNEKKEIFRSSDDYRDFLRRLDKHLKLTRNRLGAFCLMPNHIHLLIERRGEPISRLMHAVLSSYALRYNERHERVGHLFQGRYKSFLVASDDYMGALVRYIHENPHRAKLKRTDRCAWSSEAYYLGGFASLRGLVRAPGFEGKKGVAAYRVLMRLPEDNLPKIEKGLAGTPEELRLIEKRKKTAAREPRRERRKKPEPLEVLGTVARETGISIEKIQGSGRSRDQSTARRKAAQRLHKAGYGPTAISRVLRRAPSSVVEMLNK